MSGDIRYLYRVIGDQYDKSDATKKPESVNWLLNKNMCFFLETLVFLKRTF